jgi:superfamily II DNA helicase RecQ
LRTLRKTLADQEGVPAYALFTKEQLADMVRRPVLSLEGLAGIDGVGQARVEKYGDAFPASSHHRQVLEFSPAMWYEDV